MQRAMRGAGASILVMALLGAVPATAQATDGEPAAQESVGFDEILVTAQRREERLQDIPVAISAFGSEQLERQGITDISTVAPRVPSFYFGSFGATRPQLYIRGIGTRSFDPGSESSVGVFVDDVYLGRASGSFASLRDVERIEVLRGPQGTLYGRNTIGGAINVITKSPTSSFEGQVEAGVSNYKGYNVFGAVGGPLTSSGTVQFRVAGWRDYREGYLTNLTTGTTFQGIDNTGGRAKLAFEPSNAVRIELTAEYTTDGDEAAFAGFNRGSGPIVNPVTGVRTPANPAAIFLGAPGRTPIVNPGGNSGYVSVDPRLDREAQTYIARGEFDLGFASLTSITGYRKLATDEARDLEGSSRSVLDQLGRERSKQLTQEFRLASNPDGALSFGGALDWVIGGFYYHDKSLRIDTFLLGIDSAVRAAAGTPATDATIADFKSDSYAAFGQATVHLGEKFDVTVGARYTRDEKRAIQSGTTTDAAPLITAPFSVSNSAVYFLGFQQRRLYLVRPASRPDLQILVRRQCLCKLLDRLQIRRLPICALCGRASQCPVRARTDHDVRSRLQVGVHGPASALQSRRLPLRLHRPAGLPHRRPRRGRGGIADRQCRDFEGQRHRCGAGPATERQFRLQRRLWLSRCQI
jgi:iron complex outermembrane receptor protein